MLNKKLIISSVIFVLLLLITSTIKNKTRIIEKKFKFKYTNLNKEKDVNETNQIFII